MKDDWTEATNLKRDNMRFDYPIERRGDLYRRRGGESRDLVVYIHGLMGSPDNAGPRMEIVWEAYEHADVLAPALPFGLRPHKPRRVPYQEWPNVIVAELLEQVDRLWDERREQRRPYEKVMIIGASMGGLFARKLYVTACGEVERAPFEDEIRRHISTRREPTEPSPWAARVDRVVLLAAMNRGWTLSHHLSFTRGVAVWLAWMLTRFVFRPLLRREPLLAAVKRGAPMITQLRIQSIWMRRLAGERGVGGAPTVQLLGTIDDLVSPDDSLDLVTGQRFHYLEVPRSGHVEVGGLPGPGPRPGHPDLRPARIETFRDAISWPPEDLGTHPRRVTLRDYDLDEDPDIEQVVFVVHGIRDKGYWTRKVYNRIALEWPGPKQTIVSETSSYGYFPMLPFILPARRWEKVEWLMDQYTEALARYPNASFSYVGHSNGTYLLAAALKRYPACRFDRVVFAGSVVRRDYRWDRVKQRRQVSAVLNLVASRDAVVALFPGALQTIGADLGNAGHVGFDQVDQDYVAELSEDASQQRSTRRYLAGGHGQGISEGMWPTITEFVVHGAVRSPAEVPLERRQAAWVRWLGRLPWVWLVWLVIVAVLVAIGWGVVALAGAWQVPVVLLLYLYGVWKLLTWL